MPRIDSEVLPVYGPQGVVAFAVHRGHRAEFAQAIELEYSLSFPTAVDIESEVFRYYREPGFVFPLHIVVDRDGTVAFIEAGELDNAIAAIDALVNP